RDIKPENILLQGGRPMVADFGIALAVSAAAGGRMTETGLSLGTPHYMSPEQATAEREITGRSDIYSLGCVLYEMLTGNPPHTGASAQQIIMKIVTEEAAPVTKLRKAVPEYVAEAVAQAVEKLPADRFESAKAFADALAGQGTAAGPRRTRTQSSVAGAHSRSITLSALSAFAVLSVLLALSVLAAWGWLRSDPPSAGPVRLTVELPDSLEVRGGQLAFLPSMAFSRDGSLLAFVGDPGRTAGGVALPQRLFVRRLADPEVRELAGTLGASGPAFSPDGEWIAFVGADRTLRRVPAAGGTAQVLIDSVTSLSWGDDGGLYFTRPSGVWVLGTDGAVPELLVAVDSSAGVFALSFLDVLPGSRTALARVRDVSGTLYTAIADLGAGRLRAERLPGLSARFVPPGWLLFESDQSILSAIRFSPRTGRTEGSAVRLAEPVERLQNGGVDFAVAANGTLAVRWSRGTRLGPTRLVQIDPRGGSRILRDDGRRYDQPRLSPDGRQLLVRVDAAAFNTGDLWVIELASGAMTRLTTGNNSYRASWSRDGSRVFYMTGNASTSRVMTKPWDGSGADSVVLDRTGIAEFAEGPVGGWSLLRTYEQRDILLVPTDSIAAAETRAFVTGPSNETDATLSPSGRLVAYQSDETGRGEVYLRSVPGPGSRIPVSTAGGLHPNWSRDGRILYFRNGTMLMAATIGQIPALAVVRRDSLLSADFLEDGLNVTALPDQRGFIAAVGAERRALVPFRLDVITNWQSLFEPSRGRR
ncbi:MAG: protein kinase, partial [Gemmatimonadota bacterium]|nr:protein kinase [Gemmatimonadota bacterium]